MTCTHSRTDGRYDNNRYVHIISYSNSSNIRTELYNIHGAEKVAATRKLLISIKFFQLTRQSSIAAVMALRTLSFLVLVVVGLADKAPVPPKKPVQSTIVNETHTTWNNFVYCKCGVSCVEQKGSWYIFNIGQSCACQICPDTNATANLRGSDVNKAPLDAEQNEAKTSVQEGAQSLRSSTPGRGDTWDSAYIPGTNLLYCPLSRSTVVLECYS